MNTIAGPAGEPPAVQTTCPYCGVGCGIIARAKTDGTVEVAGDPAHPANFGRLCSKGSALGETVDLAGRLLQPEIGGRRTDWSEALDLVAGTFLRTIALHGPDSVALYVSGQLLTEDYYVANKLMKGFIGSANIDTNSRLCMASSVAGHRRAFGSDTVPGTYSDLEQADLVILTGSNLAWCHPVLYQRIAAAKAERPGMKVVVIDPRRTATTDIADMHLAIRPDGDVALFLGLLAHLARQGHIDDRFVSAHVAGLGHALAAAIALTLADISHETGLDRGLLTDFFTLFAATEKVVTVYSQGVNQSAVGTDKVNAIINCHLATGRIGRPGMGPFSVTGQPNAMGGREVGGMANMLAAHLAIEDPEHRDLVQRFWQSPTIAARPGLKAVELFDAVADGRIKALWIMATNPADSVPNAGAVAAAIEACPFVVVSDVIADTDTVRLADVKLPALAWGEKDGTVTNSERRISRQRAFLPAPGLARPDWWIIAEVARRMGFGDAFAWRSVDQVFAEHAALSGFQNGGTRDFDLTGLAGIDYETYQALAPVQWPVRSAADPDREKRFFGDGRFFTPDGKARAVAVRAPAEAPEVSGRPLTLNTGRVRDHWHTMTRTGRSPRLSAHLAEPFAEINPADAAELGIGDATIVELSNERSSVLLRALVTPRQQRGAVFAPMHWTDQFASRARVNGLVAPVTDPHSGQPALKNVPVYLRPFPASCYGFAVSAKRPRLAAADYMALATTKAGWRAEFAMAELPDDTVAFARGLLDVADDAQMLGYADSAQGRQRLAFFDGDRLVGALFLAPDPVAVSRAAAVAALESSFPDQRSRFHVVAGRAGADRPDPGAIICSCFAVGINQIVAAIRSGQATSVDALGQCLKAGTNCGSCRSELRAIVDAHSVVAAE